MKKPLAFLAAALIQVCAWATTYTFTGPTYTNLLPFTSPCTTPTCANYTSAMRQTGSFTTAAPLPPNLTNSDIESLIQSYSFSDGLNQYSSQPGQSWIDIAAISTDAAGKIVDESIRFSSWQTADHGAHGRTNNLLVNFSSDTNAYCVFLASPGVCGGSDHDSSTARAETSYHAGGWVISNAPASGPASVPALGEWGLLILAGLMIGAGWLQASRRHM